MPGKWNLEWLFGKLQSLVETKERKKNLEVSFPKKSYNLHLEFQSAPLYKHVVMYY